MLIIMYVLVGLRFDIHFFLPKMSRAKYNTLPCLFLCTFSIGLRFDVNFVRK
ncbi:hypothetical protein HanPI659440_Chr08g0291831 [Helianthus annuus]|nr:hypothetical protein HanPI659440_Chr08g0291831 [Helianthus annuus]